MPAARPHSIALQSRLAVSLALVAGYANVIALTVCGEVVSHVTGHATRVGMTLASGDAAAMLLPLCLLVSFLAGAFIAGVTTEFGRRRGWPSIFMLPAGIEIALLLAFAVGVQTHDPRGADPGAWRFIVPAIAAVAMGLQNATITRISRGEVRTTHLTGVVTDLGHELAQLVMFRAWIGRTVTSVDRDRGGPSMRRLALLGMIAASFLAGCVLGALAHDMAPLVSMLPAIALLAWVIVSDFRTPIGEVQETMLAGLWLPSRAGREIACFRIVMPRQEGVEPAALPDLAAWIAGLDARKRGVILDVRGMSATSMASALSLHALLERANAEGRRVVLAGLGPAEIESINALVPQPMLDGSNTAPRVPDAVAMLVA